MQLSVIIVNYNVKYFLEHCLGAVIKAIENTDAEIFVVDNNSTDGSKDYFKNKFPQVQFIWNESNEGFSKANNKALQLATGKYVLFLNPDTLVAEDTFEKCISFITAHDDDVACGVKMIDGHGNFLKESKRGLPLPMPAFYRLFGLSLLFPRSKIFSRYHLGYLDENLNHEVDVLAGAFMMIPKKILDKTGAFDESFFMYGEDIDLSYRIRQAGFKNFYLAETCIIHFKGESTGKQGLKYVKMFYRAMSIFAKKNYGTAKAGMYNIIIQLAIFIRAGLAALARLIKWPFHIFSNFKQQKPEQITAICNSTENTALSLYLENTGSFTINYIDPDTINDTQGLAEIFIGKKRITQSVILCESLSFKKIIQLLPTVPAKTTIKFFNGNSLLSNAKK